MSRSHASSSRLPHPRWILAGLGLLGVVAAMATPTGVSDRLRTAVVELRTEVLPPTEAGDKGTVMTRGAGVEPTLTPREQEILREGRIALDAAKARLLTATPPAESRPSPADVDRMKLDRLADTPPISPESRANAPDAIRKGE